MEIDIILVDEPAPNVSRITMNRPEKRNALNHPLRGAILEQLRANDQDPDVRVYDHPRRRAVVLGRLRPRRRQRRPRAAVLHARRRRSVAAPRHRGLDEHLGSRQAGDRAGRTATASRAGASSRPAATSCTSPKTRQMGYPAVRFGVPDMHFHAWFLGMRRAMEMMITGDSISGDRGRERRLGQPRVPRRRARRRRCSRSRAQIAAIPPELVQLNKRLVHRQMDVMGMRAGIRAGTELCALGTHTQAMRDFVGEHPREGPDRRAARTRRRRSATTAPARDLRYRQRSSAPADSASR